MYRRVSVVPCRRIFEGFGGLKGVVNAARTGMGADQEITFRNSWVDMEPAAGGDGASAAKVALRAIRLRFAGPGFQCLSPKP